MDNRLKINKCVCGGEAELRKSFYATEENRMVEEREWAPIDDGRMIVHIYQVQKKVPKKGTCHYIQCFKCNRRTDAFGTKTRAIENWNRKNDE